MRESLEFLALFFIIFRLQMEGDTDLGYYECAEVFLVMGYLGIASCEV